MSKHIKLSNSSLSTSLSIGTESVGLTSTENKKGNLNGGFMGLFDDNIAKLALDACKDEAFDVVMYLVNNKKIKDYSTEDENGLTLLHYLIGNYYLIDSYDPSIVTAIDTILADPNVSDFINKQDNKHGNTPLHLCVMTQNTNICNKLIKAGANPRIKNNKNLYVGTEDDSSVSSDAVVIASNCASEQDVKQFVDKAVDTLYKMEKDKSSELSKTISESFKKALSESSATNANNTTDFMDFMIKKYSADKPVTQQQVSQQEIKQQPVISQPENVFVKAQPIENKASTVPNTSEFMNDMLKNVSSQQGGFKSGRILGSRQLNSSRLSNYNSNLNTAEEVSESQYGGSPKRAEHLSELSRMIENQADETHKRVVERIKELLKVDDVTAKAYKAWLYSKVKAEKPELNNYDRAVEMEKMTTQEILNQAEKSKIDEIKAHISQKEKARNEKISEIKSDTKKETKKTSSKKEKKVSRSLSKKSKKIKGGAQNISDLSFIDSSDDAEVNLESSTDSLIDTSAVETLSDTSTESEKKEMKRSKSKKRKNK